MSDNSAPERHWADRAADEVLARGHSQPVIATGISPSGVFHVGHLREILTGDAVARALRDRKAPARLVFVVDDVDPLRKVHRLLDEAVFAPRLGQPLFRIPAPEGEGSYADYYLRPFLAALGKLHVDCEVVRAHQLYASGAMEDVVFTALERQAQIAAILQEVTGKEEVQGHWSPWNPLCASCGRIDKGRVLGFDRSRGTIRSRCEACGEESEQPAAGGGKLTWRVDWPARWKAMGVTVEPFGKDHASRGGSYDTGERIAREVFGIEPPHPIVYEWIALKGQGDMSSSKGNVLAADELLHVAPPEVLRYVVLKNRPQRAIQFDPGAAFLRLVDEVDDASAAGVDSRALELSRARGFTPIGVPFHHLVLVAQIARFDLDRTLALLERGGYRSLDREAVAARMAMARYWLDRFAPEEARVEVPEGLPAAVAALDAAQRAFLGRLAEALPTLGSAEAIQDAIRDLANQEGGPGAKRGFEAVYAALIGRARGPRAGSFIEILGIDKVAERFRRAATA
ncbi:MAG: lysine--tRNA ligase [Acidobacteria bacterium]|nr:lysine--tRNA ligase [Acidobacteriota bacterium]